MTLSSDEAEVAATLTHGATAAAAEISGATVLVQVLAEGGVEAIYLNPGTDTGPVQEAVRLAERSGQPGPALVLCPHESVALAAAHAHFALTGKPQAVLVHVDVGTQNLGAMVHNAMRGEAGVLIMAGRTPLDETGQRPGGRDRIVHWMQDVPDPHGPVRAYMKATFDAENADSVADKARRALHLAGALPAGPVYLTLPRESLMDATNAPPPQRSTRSFPPGPDADAVQESVRLIRAARTPVIVTSRLGRDPAAIAPLIRLAEHLNATVIDQRERMNFPGDHPLLATSTADIAKAWQTTDLVIVLDAPVPWVPKNSGPPDDCPVIVVDTDPAHATIPNWGFPVDLAVIATPRAWLDAVNASLMVDTRPPAHHEESAAPMHARALAASPPDRGVHGGQLGAEHVFSSLAAHLRPEDILIDESTTNAGHVARYLPRGVPGTLLRSGGSGLGWALGALLGAGIAAPTSQALAVVGDGSFLFSAPLAALVAMKRAGTGGLIVVLQNGGYAASSRPVHELFPDRDAVQPLATAFDVPLDLAAVARACGATGVDISSHDQLDAGIQAAVAAWRAGELVILGAHISSPWISAATATR